MLKIHITCELSTFKHNHKMSNRDTGMLIRFLNESMLPFHEFTLKLNLSVEVIGH